LISTIRIDNDIIVGGVSASLQDEEEETAAPAVHESHVFQEARVAALEF